MNNKTVGIFHPFPSYRSALVEELNNDEMNFMCEEIKHSKKMKNVNSDVIVIFSPEFNSNGMNLEDFKATLEKLDKTLIIVTYDIEAWKMNRNRTFYLHQKDNQDTLNDVKRILVLEFMRSRDKNSVGL